jgi:hypothetical protein
MSYNLFLIAGFGAVFGLVILPLVVVGTHFAERSPEPLRYSDLVECQCSPRDVHDYGPCSEDCRALPRRLVVDSAAWTGDAETFGGIWFRLRWALYWFVRNFERTYLPCSYCEGSQREMRQDGMSSYSDYPCSCCDGTGTRREERRREAADAAALNAPGGGCMCLECALLKGYDV